MCRKRRMTGGRQRRRQRGGNQKFALFRRGGNKISFFVGRAHRWPVLSCCGQDTPASFISSSQDFFCLFGWLSIHLRSPLSSRPSQKVDPSFRLSYYREHYGTVFYCSCWVNLESLRTCRTFVIVSTNRKAKCVKQTWTVLYEMFIILILY